MDPTARPDSDAIELVNLEQAEWTEQGHSTQSLPRTDGGKDAWLFLTACFILEALVWGNLDARTVGQASY